MNQLEFNFFAPRKKENTMKKIMKPFWFVLGIILVGVAYLGVIVPGLPWSKPILGATFCFAKSSDRFHNWIMNHKTFGPFIKNWSKYRVYPTKAKYLMVAVMSSSLAFLWFTTGNPKAVLYLAITMALIVFWAWRYPGSQAEAEKRIKLGKKIGWLK